MQFDPYEYLHDVVANFLCAQQQLQYYQRKGFVYSNHLAPFVPLLEVYKCE